MNLWSVEHFLDISFIKIGFSCNQDIGETLFWIEWVSLQWLKLENKGNNNKLERDFDLQAWYLYFQINLKHRQKLNILFPDL